MDDNTTPKPPEKKIKTATPISESRAMQITDQDTYELKEVMEASENTGYLSPLGRKIIKNSLLSDKPLDLKAINQTVLEKEDGGYNYREGQPKKGDEEDEENVAEVVADQDVTANDFCIGDDLPEEKMMNLLQTHTTIPKSMQ